jgi:hypothetical protein
MYEEAEKKRFIDRTADSWVCKEDEKKIIFCASIFDIINGKSESYTYTDMEQSVKKEKNAQGGTVERKKYILFTVNDNSKILVRARGQMK